MSRHFPTSIALILFAALSGAAPAAARSTSPSTGHGYAPRQVLVKFEGERFGRAVSLPPKVGVRRAARALRHSPRISYAVPNFIATASARAAGIAEASVARQPAKSTFAVTGTPNDPGNFILPLNPPGSWVLRQWNFLPWEGPATPVLPISPGGVDAVGAWQNLIEAGRPGARGVTVAVLDTGIAYRAKGRHFRRSPDFTSKQFVAGYDFVNDDKIPLDENGHGTHVAGTVAEKTDNGIALAGLAYNAKLMPVRVLDRDGRGQADDIANGIRFAASRGADVINMSFNFGCGKAVPEVNYALRLAYRKGVVAVASIGNLGSETCVSSPATGPHVIGVGGSTKGGCLGGYSLVGRGVDVLAPGGGTPVPGCASVSADPIYQITLRGGNPRRFGIPDNYVGTSMAAAHVSAGAAMVIAAHVVGPKRKNRGRVGAVTRRLRATARSLGLSGRQQGSGLIDLGRATEPKAKSRERLGAT